MLKFKSIQFTKSMVEIPSEIIKGINFYYNIEEDCYLRFYYKDSLEFIDVYDFNDLTIKNIEINNTHYTTIMFQITDENLYMLCYNSDSILDEHDYVIIDIYGNIIKRTDKESFDDFNEELENENNDKI